MKIAEVSEKYDLSTDTLRYYERIGLIQPVSRNKGGIRDYGENELHRIEFIKCMRRAGLPIEVLSEYIHLVEQGDSTTERRRQILLEQREKLIGRMSEMQQTLDLLDYKISFYETTALIKDKTVQEIQV